MARDRVGSAGWARLEAARDPAAAAAARDADSLASTVTHRDQDLPVRNGRQARRGAVVACAVCGVQWCPLPGGYRTVTCSSACWRQLQSRNATAHGSPNRERDAQIVAAVMDLGRPVDQVAAQHGIGPERVRQILRKGRA